MLPVFLLLCVWGGEGERVDEKWCEKKKTFCQWWVGAEGKNMDERRVRQFVPLFVQSVHCWRLKQKQFFFLSSAIE